MQFVSGGPDVPERLIQAHEDGRVVFFCGAGISYPAGLPSFSGLVKRLYSQVGVSPNALEQAALKARQYDTTIGLLELRLAPDGQQGRQQVRRVVESILTATTISRKTTATHASLLTLARCRDGRTRLVTTNFDRLFNEVIARDALQLSQFHAPLLPVPKNRWNGLVYLHGLLGQLPGSSDLDQLVLSSGDFGLAYLTERWAARFVSELFRSYTVCFIGYSINDPVLRYMMDALAADRILGESPPEMFAFGVHSKGKDSEQWAEWKAKNVTPILYRAHSNHFYLHRTLSAWAATYRDGVGGKEQIVVQHAHLQPQDSTRQEDFVGRVLWALSDGSGLPARRLADMVPAPSFDWVEPFIERRFGHDDLVRFGVSPLQMHEEKRVLEKLGSSKPLAFSLLERPAPYLRAPWMTAGHWRVGESIPDDVMQELYRWLLRYLDEPKLIHWLVKRGGALSYSFKRLVEHRLDQIGEWERLGNLVQRDELRRSSPQAIPRRSLRVVWRLLLTGQVKTSEYRGDLYQWLERFHRDGLTASLRLELRQLLAPRIALREPYRLEEQDGMDGEGEEADSLKSLVNWDLVLASDHVHSALRVKQVAGWQEALPVLLEDATGLLRDALDLLAELGSADAKSDLSYIHQSSISEHPQNRDFNDWTALIDLSRDSWIAVANTDPERARLVAKQWWGMNYPLFRRLSFFAAAHQDVISIQDAVTWLISDGGWWLWSVETEREVLRLLTTLALRVERRPLDPLEAVILAGPPREMFRGDLEPGRWERIVEREVWLRLAKLDAAGTQLGEGARARLEELGAGHPEWQLAPDARDEFPFWMGAGDEEMRSVAPTPKLPSEMVQWLRRYPVEDHWTPDDWAERCRKDFRTTAVALLVLSRENVWPASRWRSAIQAWGDDALKLRAWRCMAPTLIEMPGDVFVEVAHSVGWWLQKVAKEFDSHVDTFFAICARLLLIDHQGGLDTEDPVTSAINHPVGHATQALLNWWYRRELQNDQGLPLEIEPIFTRLCNIEQQGFRHGRVLLAAHAINLFLVDRNWATRHLMPLFEWHRSRVEARAAWGGFLWSPRLVRPYLAAIKPTLLETARYYAELGSHGRQYAAFLTYAALDRGETFAVEELREAFRALPLDGLAEVASALSRGMEGAGEQRESYWRNRVAPFWKDVWPKPNETSSEIADDLFRLCVAAGGDLPAALLAVRPWLVPVPHPDYLVHLLHESGLCSTLPDAALDWLSLLMDAQPWAPRQLRACLQIISQASPELLQDPRYRRLAQYCRGHGL